jgi:hypothetical protein
MENRSCLIVNACLTPADGHAERTAALANDRTSGRSPDQRHAGRRQGL